MSQSNNNQRNNNGSGGTTSMRNSLPSFETTTIRSMGEISTSDYELNMYKLNCIESFYPYLIVGCRKQLIIYQVQIGNNNRENVSYHHKMTYKLESEINYMTKSENDKILIVGEKGLVKMLTKISIRIHHHHHREEEENDNSSTNTTNSTTTAARSGGSSSGGATATTNSSTGGDSADSRLEKLGLKLINLYKNGTESTWSISYYGGVWALGDNSHVVKVQMPLVDHDRPFELYEHTHNLPHLNLYCRNRLLSCSIDQSCKIWDIEAGKVLHSHEFNEWCWMGEHVSTKHFITLLEGDSSASASDSSSSNKNSNEHIIPVNHFCSDVFIIGTQNYIYLLNDTLDTVLYKMFYKPFRGLSCIPQYMYESLDRVSFCKVIPRFSLVLLAKQNDNKVILFRMVHSISSSSSSSEEVREKSQIATTATTANSNSEEEEEQEKNKAFTVVAVKPPSIMHSYSLVPISCLPEAKNNSENQCIIGITYDDVLDRVFIQCLDGQIFSYDLNIITSPLTSTCVDNIVI